MNKIAPDSADRQPLSLQQHGYQVLDNQVCRGLRPLHQKDGTPLPIANPQAFRLLARRWATDGQSIIVQAQQGSSIAYEYFYRIDDADLATFQVLNQRYAKDHQHAWYLTGKSIRYAGDFHLLTCSQPQFDECGRVIGSSEFEDEFIAVDERFVYVTGTRLRGAHGPSFRHLGSGYYRDRQHAYWRNKRLDVDVDSFLVVQIRQPGQQYSSLLVGDRHGPLGSAGVVDSAIEEAWTVFFLAHPDLHDYWWHKLQAVGEETALRPLGQGFELGRQVHFHGRPINGLDAASFRLLDTHFCGDANGLYLIPFHNPDSAVPEQFSQEPAEHFRSLGGPYLTDGKSIFCHRIFYHPPDLLRKADAASFESCGYGWARDRHAVYYYGEAKKRLDPVETRILGSYAIAPATILAQGKLLDVPFSADEIRVPHPDFLQLGTRKLFCGRRPLSARRIDLASLEFLSDRHARDKHRFYYYDGYATLGEVDEQHYLQAAAQKTGQAHE